MMTPLDCWRAGMEFATMMAEAQIVISLRLMGMAGVWNTPKGEHRRMVSEKAAAAQESGLAAARAMVSGAKPSEVARAALSPVRRRTRANVARLTKRGVRTKA
ncbi:MAG: hypothetical protein RLZZ528_1173 [Pseudomonadota bacterium]